MQIIRGISRITVVTAVVAMTACSVKEDLTHPATETGNGLKEEIIVQLSPEEQEQAFYLPGTAVVKFSEEMAARIEATGADGSEDFSRLCAELGVNHLERLFPYAGEYEERTRADGLHRYYTIEFDDDIPLTRAAQLLERTEGIDLFERQHKISRNVSVDDSYFPKLWGLNDSNEYSINVQEAWRYTMGNPKVTVAVVDGGIQLNHPDLEWNCGDEHFNFVTNSSKINPESHGTHVAGTIAGVGNNSIGVIGIAGGNFMTKSPGVRLMSCQVFDGNKSASSFAYAIKWSADHGAVISQNSWGYSFDSNNDGKLTGTELSAALNATIDDSLKAAVDYFIKYAGCDNTGETQLEDSPMKGGIVIFAAGNDGIRNGAPANYEPIISVGATTASGNFANYSNYGSWVDICAPGDEIYSTIPSSQYINMSGTSMACPHVSGAAALLLSYFGQKGLTNDDLEDMLISGANPDIIHYLGHNSGPYLDVLSSFKYGLTKYKREYNTAPVIELGTDTRDFVFHQWEEVSLPIRIYDPDNDNITVEMEIEGRAKITRDSEDDYIYNFTLLCELVNDFKPMKVKITARDDYEGETSLEFTYRVIENRAPEATDGIDDFILYVGGSTRNFELENLFTDPDGEELKYSCSASPSDRLVLELVDGSLCVSGKSQGAASVKIVATDRLGKKAEISFNVLARQTGSEMEVYPNPVKDFLYIRTGLVPENVQVRISGVSGSTIFDDSLECSAFSPGRIDMSNCAPGSYSLRITYMNRSIEKTLIKE